MGCASTVCFPVVAIVYEEVGDFTEGFEQDGVVEWHGDDDDGGMMSGGKGVALYGGFFVICDGVFVLAFVEYGSWFSLFRFVFHFFSCAIEF